MVIDEASIDICDVSFCFLECATVFHNWILFTNSSKCVFLLFNFMIMYVCLLSFKNSEY